MKIEIEVTPEEIKSAIERKVRLAIADQTTGYAFDDYVKKCVTEAWKPAVKELIHTELENISKMQEKVKAAIELKLKNQITALMKGVK